MRKTENSKTTFYSARGVAWLIVLLCVFAMAALIGMYKLGIVGLPRVVTGLFSPAETGEGKPLFAGSPIAPEPETAAPIYEAIPNDKIAAALAELSVPAEGYRAYTVTLYGGGKTLETAYETVWRGSDWWVQSAQDGIILSTAVAKGSTVYLTDHTLNVTTTAKAASAADPDGVTFAERSGVLPLSELLTLIGNVAVGEATTYGGGVTEYSLSYTPRRSGNENHFRFTCKTAIGTEEEYTFSFENAVLLSAQKTIGGKLIYQMENTAYRNDLSQVHADSLFD